ncbi:MAG: hypothetical protein Q9211_002809 [Gyalolechia sp. 1 TL-2023]
MAEARIVVVGQLPKEQLGHEYDNGNAFTSVCINTAIYLPWLVSQCLQKGVVFKRANLRHISDAANLHHSGRGADAVVNCTGLAALKLGGVEDQNMMPIRGQTVLVRNEANVMCSSSGTDDGEEEVCYLMQRAVGGGTLLGGSYQRGNWDSQLDPSLAVRIMKRAVELCPALTGGKGIEHLDIIRHGVGRCGADALERTRETLKAPLWGFVNYAFTDSVQYYPELGPDGNHKRFNEPEEFIEKLGPNGVTFIRYAPSSAPGPGGNAKIIATARYKLWSTASKIEERVKMMNETVVEKFLEPGSFGSRIGFHMLDLTILDDSQLTVDIDMVD